MAGAWKTACHDRCKPSTRRRTASALRTQLLPAFGPLPLDRIDQAAVHRWFDDYSRTAPGGANRTLDVLRQIFNHAMVCGHVTANPTRGVRRNPRPKPTRFLSQAEIERLHTALDAHRGRGSGRQQADVVRLLLLTGCRKSELLNLRWSEAGEDTLHLTDTKTGPRPVFLNVQARSILASQPRTESPYVFPSLADASKARSSELSLWRKVRRQAGIEDVRLHDLRHYSGRRIIPSRLIKMGGARVGCGIGLGIITDCSGRSGPRRPGGIGPTGSAWGWSWPSPVPSA